MPVYEYRCVRDAGHAPVTEPREVEERDAAPRCPLCSGAMRRAITAPAVNIAWKRGR